MIKMTSTPLHHTWSGYDRISYWCFFTREITLGTFGLTPRPAQFGSQRARLITGSLLADGDAHTGGAFGGSQGEQCPVVDANFCDFQRKQLPAPTGAQASGNVVTGDQDMEDAWDEEDEEEPSGKDGTKDPCWTTKGQGQRMGARAAVMANI